MRLHEKNHPQSNYKVIVNTVIHLHIKKKQDNEGKLPGSGESPRESPPHFSCHKIAGGQ
jgi:hypothetical protein